MHYIYLYYIFISLYIEDWSGKTNMRQMRHYISTPKIGLKRKLHERFEIYNIDEFRTSCLNHKTEEKCENLYLPDKKGKSRKLHAVLTFKMENNRYGCINRDWNAVRNMKKITDYWLQYGKRLIKYRRNYDLKTGKLKGSNPCKKASNKTKPINSRRKVRAGVQLQFVKSTKFKK